MPIKVLFLTHFNIHKGYELVWWKSIMEDETSKENIEFRTLPSGLHSIHKDVICFKHGELFGLSVFRQNSLGLADMDRSKVKMYSIGVLTDDPIDQIWKFKDQLDINLSQLMVSDFTIEDLDAQLNPLFVKLTEISKDPSISSSSTSTTAAGQIKQIELIDEFKPMFENLGPLLFTIWKLGLLKKRLIFYMQGNECDHELLNKYIFCLNSILKINDENDNNNNNNEYPSDAIYNVCISDIPILNNKKTFIASTSDQIILEKPQLFDYSIMIPYSDSNLPEIKNNKGEIVYSTGRDLTHFKLIYEQVYGHLPNLDYDKMASYKSLSEMVWFVMNWWATAGDSLSFDRDIDVPLLCNENLDGYFRRLNKKMISDLNGLINDNGDEPINPHDLYEIGFDPFNLQDIEFIKEFTKQRFNRDILIGNYMNCLC